MVPAQLLACTIKVQRSRREAIILGGGLRDQQIFDLINDR